MFTHLKDMKLFSLYFLCLLVFHQITALKVNLTLIKKSTLNFAAVNVSKMAIKIMFKKSPPLQLLIYFEPANQRS